MRRLSSAIGARAPLAVRQGDLDHGDAVRRYFDLDVGLRDMGEIVPVRAAFHSGNMTSGLAYSWFTHSRPRVPL